ncbi:hypothetical protein [Haloarchaeobius sp. HRN-SO-5]|uniref:hypothetical protein n=1 Tax=Haloarchaeobius sp. HRN-SO-5 TaxID=3446118 RepID=UPI003EB838D4
MRVPGGWYGGYTLDAELDGVVVRKGLDLETLPLPAVKFAIESTRDAPVGVRLTERLPDPVRLDHVAVHADHGGQHWTAFTDGRLVYTGSVPPGETVVTLFMIWLEEPDHVYRFFGRPHLRVTSNPNAPSLRPVGVETDVRSVDGRFSSDESFARIRAAVERSLSTPADPRATAGDATGPDAPGQGAAPPGDDATTAGSRTGDATVTTTTAVEDWSHPVVRGGACELGPPDDAVLEELVDGPTAPGSYLVRVETRDAYRGGGAVVVAQELANAFDLGGRRVTDTGDSELVEAVVVTDHPPERVVLALTDRRQVVDVFVSPLTAEPAEPDSQDEVVATFEELAAEFDPVDADELEAELEETDFPGPDGDDVTIAELVDDDMDVAEIAENADDDELRTLQDEIGRLADHIVELEAELAMLEGPSDNAFDEATDAADVVAPGAASGGKGTADAEASDET